MAEALKLLKEQKHLLELKEIEFIKKYLDNTKRITNKEITRIVYSILSQKKYKLKDVLKVAKLSKATYMRWIKRLNEKDKDSEIKEKMIQIKQENLK